MAASGNMEAGLFSAGRHSPTSQPASMNPAAAAQEAREADWLARTGVEDVFDACGNDSPTTAGTGGTAAGAPAHCAAQARPPQGQASASARNACAATAAGSKQPATQQSSSWPSGRMPHASTAPAADTGRGGNNRQAQPPSSANRLLSSNKQAGGQPPAWRPLMRSSACQKDDVACRADEDAPAAGFERFAFTGPSPQSGVLQALNLKQEGTLLNIQWKQALLQLLDVIKGSSSLWAACLGCFYCQMSVVQAC